MGLRKRRGIVLTRLYGRFGTAGVPRLAGAGSAAARVFVGLAVALCLTCAFAGGVASASSLEFPEFWTGCFEGGGAGQCGYVPRGVATSPVDGHVFVADS